MDFFVTEMEFTRITFDSVTACTNPLKKTLFGVKADVVLKKLGSLPSFPNLEEVFSHKKSGDFLPDYNSLLGKAMLLREEVLCPFLLTFQEHLEEIQVFLGGIDGWLLQTNASADLLEEIFGTKLEFPEAKELYHYCDGQSCKIIHQGDSNCTRCNKPFSSHREAQEDVSTLSEDSPCRRTGHFCMASVVVGRLRSGSFLIRPPKAQILQEYPTPGEYKHIFHVNELTDQKRLKKFLEFVAMCSE
jgi:hypothetical protein